MIKLHTVTKKKFDGTTILMLVENIQGALKAGQFVLNHLYNDKVRVILLQTYTVQGLGLFLMRNLSQILEGISLEDLTMLKNKLIEEFEVPPDKIQKLAIEGDLATILKNKFGNVDNLTVVIGEDQNPLKHKIPCKQIITIMKATNISNIFYIDENITFIDRNKMLIISEKPDKIHESFKNFIVNISKKFSIDIEYITTKNKDSVLMPDDPAINSSNDNDSDFNTHNTIKNILKERVINSNTKNDINK